MSWRTGWDYSARPAPRPAAKYGLRAVIAICDHVPIRSRRIGRTGRVRPHRPGHHPQKNPLTRAFSWMADRVGFEPTWGDKAPNRFRIGAVVTASVPVRVAVILLWRPCGPHPTDNATRKASSPSGLAPCGAELPTPGRCQRIGAVVVRPEAKRFGRSPGSMSTGHRSASGSPTSVPVRVAAILLWRRRRRAAHSTCAGAAVQVFCD